MRIGRRPDERHNAVILDLFGKLSDEEDRTLLKQALKKDDLTPLILLQIEELRDISDLSFSTLLTWHKEMQASGKRLVLVRPAGKVREYLSQRLAHPTTLGKVEIVENESDAFKDR